MSKSSIFVLIAICIWCAAAAGETLPVAIQALEQNDYSVILVPPCNWDKNLDNVTVNGVYAHPGKYTGVATYSILDRESVVNVPITPIKILSVDDSQILLELSESLPKMHDGKYLYHLNVEIPTTNQKCKDGFGFGTLTRPR